MSNRVRHYESRICEKCGSEFTARSDRVTRFCSHRCASLRLSPKVCPVCKKQFNPRFANTIYCSRSCSTIANNPPGNFVDLTGQRFGRLVVISRVENRNHNSRWLCQCECCNTTIVQYGNLTKGSTSSCGCLQREITGNLLRTHGMTKSKIYRVWCAIKDRCLNSNTTSYRHYGGRGITMCDRWANSFEEFWQDMGSSYQHGLMIERIDNNGNYEPVNCRWATPIEQARNKRNNLIVDSPLGRMTMAELAERSGIKYNTLQTRLYAGWSAEALLRPPRKLSNYDRYNNAKRVDR